MRCTLDHDRCDRDIPLLVIYIYSVLLYSPQILGVHSDRQWRGGKTGQVLVSYVWHHPSVCSRYGNVSTAQQYKSTTSTRHRTHMGVAHVPRQPGATTGHNGHNALRYSLCHRPCSDESVWETIHQATSTRHGSVPTQDPVGYSSWYKWTRHETRGVSEKVHCYG